MGGENISTFKGLQRTVHRASGIECSRVSHDADHKIGEHKHSWPTLTVVLAGSAREEFDDGEIKLSGPTAIFHPGGISHSDLTDRCGLETVGITFDPSWLRDHGLSSRLDRSRTWTGMTAALARSLLLEWHPGQFPEQVARRQLSGFFELALAESPLHKPGWLEPVERSLRRLSPPSTNELAVRHGLHPAWLARSYRRLCGEGLHETARRRRVEAALAFLRTSDFPLAEIAALSGFCDQAHMNRCFRAVLQLTPTEILQGPLRGR